jgi:hypothetical protein
VVDCFDQRAKISISLLTTSFLLSYCLHFHLHPFAVNILSYSLFFRPVFYLLPLHITLSPSHHGRMARGGHGLPKVSSGPAMPDPSMPCGQATPDDRFRVGSPAGWAACSRLLPLWTPHAVRLCLSFTCWCLRLLPLPLEPFVLMHFFRFDPSQTNEMVTHSKRLPRVTPPAPRSPWTSVHWFLGMGLVPLRRGNGRGDAVSSTGQVGMRWGDRRSGGYAWLRLLSFWTSVALRVRVVGVWRGVSKGVEDGRRPPTLRAGYQ